MLKIKWLLMFMILTASVFADREPSPFEETYKVIRTNMKTGEEYSEELIITWFGKYYLLESIQGGGGGELLEQEGIEFAGWMAAADTNYGGSVGLYKTDDDGITGLELFIPDTTFYIIKSDGAETLELSKQWTRGHYHHLVFSDENTPVDAEMDLVGDSLMWTMTYDLSGGDDIEIGAGYGLSSGNCVAVLFHESGIMILRLYTIAGGNLEGRWLYSWWDDVEGSPRHSTGAEELWVQKIYE